jgi:acyl carrier protein
VTGGLGALGLRVASWLAAKGAGHLVLAGRRPATEAARAEIERLSAGGCGVTVMQADLSREEDIRRVLSGVEASLPGLRGVFHLAGVTADAPFAQQDWESFEQVMTAKVRGAWMLHRLTATTPLDHFVLFSSAAAVWGSPAQGNYAAANAFLDALAHFRRRRAMPALSVDWGPWEEIGMAARAEALETFARFGVRGIAPDAAIAALERMLEEGATQIVAARLDLTRVGRAAAWPRTPALFADLVESGASRMDAEAASRARIAFRQQLERLPERSRKAFVREHVQSEVARVLGLDPQHAPDPHQPLNEIGLDSFMAVELAGRLEAVTGKHFPPTAAFQYPTIEALSGYAGRDLLGEDPDSRQSPPAAPVPVARETGEATAPPPTAETSEEELVREVRALDEEQLEQILRSYLQT